MTNKNNPKFQELIAKLREIFQIDRPELDFGIYRILNARADEIDDYLQNRLAEKVQAALSAGSAASAQQLHAELQEAEKNAHALGVSPDAVPKVQELRAKLKGATAGSREHENAVFSHLLTFFSRYYEQGDFISQRRYKGDTYAIPYAGEEVMLHWANKDQYYTKSGENFSNYTFKLDDGRSVHFRLVAADTAKDNRKDNDKERRFVLGEPQTVTRLDEEGEENEEELQPIAEANGELVLSFEYKAMPKGSKQDALVAKAIEAIFQHEAIKQRWLALKERAPTESNPQRTILEKCLTDYTTKNTADYFIHKDLGRFLKGELDFYIKNEVMHLDDVQNAEKFAEIEKNLRMIQCLRGIALDLIAFLAQLEDFQKKLWLKKKFVVSSHYCMTLDRVPDLLFPEIAANEKQWAQWKQLGVWEGKAPGKIEDLKAAPYRMVDTSLFVAEFKAKLLQQLSSIDDHINGLLIHSDNFQALNLLQKKYSNKVSVIYVDPPYNTSASEIIYKNNYKHSSWLSLLSNLIKMGKKMLSHENGMQCTTIDDVEQKVLSQLLEEVYGEIAGTVSIRIKPSGRPIPNGFALSHEYAIFTRLSDSNPIKRLEYSEDQADRYRYSDDNGRFFWEMFRKAGSNSNRANRPTMYYPFFVSNELTVRLPRVAFLEEKQYFELLEEALPNEKVVYPIKDDGTDGCWYFGYERAQQVASEFKAVKTENGDIKIYYRRRPNEGVQPTSLWLDSKYSATEHGTALLKKLFGKQEVFSYPKSINAVEDCLAVCGVKDAANTILDYFAGSGTTGHAVINFCRADKKHRNFVLIEQGEYFETVLKPRLQKVVFSSEWANGKPTAPETGISHCFKVLKLESYEDTLNNLELRRSSAQGDLLKTISQDAREDYLLRYMLDVESRGSLLSVEDFRKPFDYTLNVAVDSACTFDRRKIDLVETFNYLIGLCVKHIDAQPQRGFVTVTGTLPSGESCLVLWRDCDVLDYEGVSNLCDKLAINPKDSEFEVVYINGDHNIPSVLTMTEEEGGITRTLKLRQIEPEFLSRMFDVEPV